MLKISYFTKKVVSSPILTALNIMKKILLYSTFVGVFIGLVIACTPNANTYYNRQMQPIVTKYNVLFNGEEAYAKGLNELKSTKITLVKSCQWNPLGSVVRCS